MNVGRRFVLVAAGAALAGLAIGWLDSRGGWDDTGITAMLVFVAAAVFAFLARRLPWLIAVLVGGWIPLLELRGPAGAGSLLALLFAAAGAAVGWMLARSVAPDRRRAEPDVDR